MKKEHKPVADNLLEAARISAAILAELVDTEKEVAEVREAVAQTRKVNNRLLNALRKEDTDLINELLETYEKDIKLARRGKKYDYKQTQAKDVRPRFRSLG